MRTVSVNICENDERGRPSGKVLAFRFGEMDDLFFFESNDLSEGVLFNSRPNPLRIFTFYSQYYLYLKRITWVGSMAYNQYTMALPEALRLLNRIAISKDFSLSDSSDVKINNLIEQGIEIKGSDMGWCDESDEVRANIFDKNQLSIFLN